MSGNVQRVGLFVLVLCLVSLPARANERAFVSGLGGVTFQTVTDANIAGNAGMSISKHVQVFGELGRTRNILPTADQTLIQSDADLASAALGERVIPSGSLRAVEGLGGVRVTGTRTDRVTPFGEAGLGVAHLTGTFVALSSPDLTDVTAQVYTMPLTQQFPATHLLMLLGGGIDIATSRRTSISAGYRYSRINTADPAPPLNTSDVYGGLRVMF